MYETIYDMLGFGNRSADQCQVNRFNTLVKYITSLSLGNTVQILAHPCRFCFENAGPKKIELELLRKLRDEDRRVDPRSPGWGREKDGEVPHERCCCFRLVWGLDLKVISTETSEKDTFFFSYLASMYVQLTIFFK